MIGVGQVSVPADGNAEYRVRDVKNIINFIIPIFDKHLLLTCKYYSFYLFREAAFILSNSNISYSDKNRLLLKLKSKKLPKNYISPAWSLNIQDSIEKMNFEYASKVMSKGWLVGFTEAEGSFYLVSKSINRLVHGFEVNQKLDKTVLLAIKYLSHIKTDVQNKKAGYFSLSTTNSRAIENIIEFYKNTTKGMKSVEYRIWARSYLNNKGDFIALNKIRDDVRIMRKNYRTLDQIKS